MCKLPVCLCHQVLAIVFDVKERKPVSSLAVESAGGMGSHPAVKVSYLGRRIRSVCGMHPMDYLKKLSQSDVLSGLWGKVSAKRLL